jgi:hypothetical protein
MASRGLSTPAARRATLLDCVAETLRSRAQPMTFEPPDPRRRPRTAPARRLAACLLAADPARGGLRPQRPADRPARDPAAGHGHAAAGHAADAADRRPAAASPPPGRTSFVVIGDSLSGRHCADPPRAAARLAGPHRRPRRAPARRGHADRRGRAAPRRRQHHARVQPLHERRPLPHAGAGDRRAHEPRQSRPARVRDLGDARPSADRRRPVRRRQRARPRPRASKWSVQKARKSSSRSLFVTVLPGVWRFSVSLRRRAPRWPGWARTTASRAR